MRIGQEKCMGGAGVGWRWFSFRIVCDMMIFLKMQMDGLWSGMASVLVCYENARSMTKPMSLTFPSMQMGGLFGWHLYCNHSSFSSIEAFLRSSVASAAASCSCASSASADAVPLTD